MPDPYKVLGVERTASQDEIKRAYRRLVKEFHPDLHPGKPKVEAKFKYISAANHLLSDPGRRAKYDCGEIDASGAARPERTFYSHFADHDGGTAFFDELRTVFSSDFRRAKMGRSPNNRMRGADLALAMRIGFIGAATGARKRIDMAGATIEVELPAGIRDDQTIRIAGKGHAGLNGGPPGDALIRVQVEAHPWFERRGNDIHLELPVTLTEAVLGAKVTVPTIEDPVILTIPRNANTGTTLRLKGKGVRPARAKKRGDQLVKLKLVLPDGRDAELERFVEGWAEYHPYNPRQHMESAP